LRREDLELKRKTKMKEFGTGAVIVVVIGEDEKLEEFKGNNRLCKGLKYNF
jgi:hypothetical protein